MTEDEFKKRLVKEIERLNNCRLSYSIAHGWSQSGLYPRLTLTVEGGDPKKAHVLACKIENALLDYSKENPPTDADFSSTRPHFLPGETQRGPEPDIFKAPY